MKGYKFLMDVGFDSKVYGKDNKRIVVRRGKITHSYEVKK